MMKKFSFLGTVAWIVGVGVIVFLLNTLFGDSLAAKLATQRWVQRYHLVQPRAPLVINTREEVRVSDTNDTIGTISKNQEKVAAVVLSQNGADTLRGAALAAISDGVWLSVGAAVNGAPLENLYIVTNTGARERVTKVVQDPGTSLVLLHTAMRGLAVPTFRSAKSAVVGERVILLGAQQDGAVYYVTSSVSSAEQTASGVLSADMPARTLPLQPVSGLMPGQTGFEYSGQVTGIFDGKIFVPASVIQEMVTAYVSHQGSIVRPVFGFLYVWQHGAGTQAGLLVTKRTEGSPAARAGIMEGDVITKVGQQEVGTAVLPDALLSTAAADAQVVLTVQRGGKTLELTVHTGAAR